MRRGFVAVAAAGALAALVACEHAQPFRAPPAAPNVPHFSGIPRQLTFNAGTDDGAAWLPDGSGIIYSYELARPDHDRCLGVLPAEGGHLTQSICHVPSHLDADSTNMLTEPAVGPGGRLAYLRISQALGARAPNSIELVVATLDAPEPGRVVRTVPYTAPDSLLVNAISHVRWLDAQTLVYVAQGAVYADTASAPFEIMRLGLSAAPPAVAVLPSTRGATSVAVDSGSALYYTRIGDSHVYRYVAGAAPDTVYDVGAAGAAGEVQVRGNVLVALAGVTLYRVDLRSKTMAVIAEPGSATFGHPALSPSGQRVVAEVSSGGAPPDLWLYQVP